MGNNEIGILLPILGSIVFTIIGFVLARFWYQRIAQKRSYGNATSKNSEPARTSQLLSNAQWEARWQEREVQLQNIQGEQQQRIRELESERLELVGQLSRLETLLNNKNATEDARQEERLGVLQQARLDFAKLSSEEQERQAAKLEHKLQPLEQQLRIFQEQLEKQFQSNLQSKGEIVQYIRSIQEGAQQLHSEAQTLSRALQGQRQKQGAWGEMILARCLEESGLRLGIEYQLQQSFQGEDGKTFRPDAVVRFPAKRYLIIDSKVSLSAYQNYLASNDPAEQEQQLAKHCASIVRHLKDLNEKSYHRLLGAQQNPDFILMFSPIEGALAEALHSQPQILEDSLRSNVILVGPTLLMLVLRLVEQIWRTDKQQHNASAVFVQAGKIYDKLALFCEDMGKMEAQLLTLNKTFKQGQNRLLSGRASLVSQVEKLHDLGVEHNKKLPYHDDSASHSPIEELGA